MVGLHGVFREAESEYLYITEIKFRFRRLISSNKSPQMQYTAK